ncbi:BrxA/BrxB family bacilliredoxin [Sorangium sp. So ce693]|uniref:BrxA/BrxB family bacilliredoxin n=1 Tax=Sorangium sp. So ce693 TaxID=3133318 RepID=UPI003F62134B
MTKAFLYDDIHDPSARGWSQAEIVTPEVPLPYPPHVIQPFKDELISIGFRDLLTSDDVDSWMAEKTGTSLLVVNAVNGVAAGMTRPAVRMALEESTMKPSRLATVFAGQDLDATAKARGYFADIPQSEPSIALFKDGELVYFLPRHRMEHRLADDLAKELAAIFEEHCS